jgi:hypothetical protein
MVQGIGKDIESDLCRLSRLGRDGKRQPDHTWSRNVMGSDERHPVGS